MAKLEDAVTEGPDGWGFVCPGFDGDPCSNWSSTGWPTKKLAVERGREHTAAHTDLIPTSSLEDFRSKHGVTVDDNGKAVL